MTRRLLLPALLCLCLTLAACSGGTPAEPAQEPAPSSAPTEPAQQPDSQPQSDPAEPVPEPDPAPAAPAEEPALAALHQATADRGDLVAIAYLGALPGESLDDLDALLDASPLLADYPFLKEIPQERILAQAGSEVYCLVPRGADVSMTAFPWVCNEENHYQGVNGDPLYTAAAGEPILLIGNISDIIPNLSVDLTGPDGTALSYQPCLSLCDGHLDLPAAGGVYDFSDYSVLPEVP